MALDWFSGFDHFATADLTTGVTPRFTSVTGTTTVTTSAVRSGTNGLRCGSGSSYAMKTGLSNAATRILGAAVRFGNVTSDPGRVFMAFGDGAPDAGGGGVQIGIALSSGGAIQVFRGRALQGASGGTQLGSNSSNVLSSNTWAYIELVVTFNGSTGTVEVFVNGSKTGWIDLAGQDTTNTANNYANAFGLCGILNNVDYDDVYVLSGTGGVRTARLGDVKAVAVLPSTGDGAVAQFTPSTGADNGAMVDEAAPNGDTDYNESTAVGNVDTYAFPALGLVGSIFGLNLHNYVKKTDASGCDTQGVVRISGTNHLQTQRAISTTYGYSSDLLEQSPATASDFTVSEVDGAEFGVRHAA